jgi:hypothetical protein
MFFAVSACRTFKSLAEAQRVVTKIRASGYVLPIIVGLGITATTPA